jgi:hypothetical protein
MPTATKATAKFSSNHKITTLCALRLGSHAFLQRQSFVRLFQATPGPPQYGHATATPKWKLLLVECVRERGGTCDAQTINVVWRAHDSNSAIVDRFGLVRVSGEGTGSLLVDHGRRRRADHESADEAAAGAIPV